MTMTMMVTLILVQVAAALPHLNYNNYDYEDDGNYDDCDDD